MACHLICLVFMEIQCPPKLKSVGSYRTKLQQQSSQLEELERQKAEIADLQQVSPHQLPQRVI